MNKHTKGSAALAVIFGIILLAGGAALVINHQNTKEFNQEGYLFDDVEPLELEFPEDEVVEEVADIQNSDQGNENLQTENNIILPLVVGEPSIAGCRSNFEFFDFGTHSNENAVDVAYYNLFELPRKPFGENSGAVNYVASQVSLLNNSSTLKYLGVSVDTASVSLYLEGTILGGHCADIIFKKQIEETAFQFDYVEKLTVYLNGEIFDFCIFDPSNDANNDSCAENPKPWVASRVIENTAPVDTTSINVPFVVAGTQGQEGLFGCGSLIEFREVQVPETTAVLTATYEHLFGLSEIPFGANGVRNPIGHHVNTSIDTDLDFVSVDIVDGVANLYLEGEILANHCGDADFKKQVEQAALQYSTVGGVTVYLNGQVFDWCALDQSNGENGCSEQARPWVTFQVEENKPQFDVSITGTLVFDETLEGGCWQFQGDDGNNYNLQGVDPQDRVSGSVLSVKANFSDQQVIGICQNGTLVDVVEYTISSVGGANEILL